MTVGDTSKSPGCVALRDKRIKRNDLVGFDGFDIGELLEQLGDVLEGTVKGKPTEARQRVFARLEDALRLGNLNASLLFHLLVSQVDDPFVRNDAGDVDLVDDVVEVQKWRCEDSRHSDEQSEE